MDRRNVRQRQLNISEIARRMPRHFRNLGVVGRTVDCTPHTAYINRTLIRSLILKIVYLGVNYYSHCLVRGSNAAPELRVIDHSVIIRLIRVHGLDEKTHPSSLMPFGHGHHDCSRLAVNLRPLILGRKGKLEMFEEGNDHNLHLKNSVEGFSDRDLQGTVHKSRVVEKVLTRTASRCMNGSH